MPTSAGQPPATTSTGPSAATRTARAPSRATATASTPAAAQPTGRRRPSPSAATAADGHRTIRGATRRLTTLGSPPARPPGRVPAPPRRCARCATARPGRRCGGCVDAVGHGQQQRRGREADDQRGQGHGLGEGVADRLAAGQGEDGGLAAAQAGGDQGQAGRVGDQHQADHHPEQVGLEQQGGAGAEQDGHDQGQEQVHGCPPSSTGVPTIRWMKATGARGRARTPRRRRRRR